MPAVSLIVAKSVDPLPALGQFLFPCSYAKRPITPCQIGWQACHAFEAPIRVFVEEVLRPARFGLSGFVHSVTCSQYGSCTRRRFSQSLEEIGAERRLLRFAGNACDTTLHAAFWFSARARQFQFNSVNYLSISRCSTRVANPFLSIACFIHSAIITDRCLPPVQPKAMVR